MISGREVRVSIRILRERGDVNHEGYLLGNVIGPGFRADGGSSFGISGGE